MDAFLALYSIYLECLNQGVQNYHAETNAISFLASFF